jgi:hypothetical protein
MAVWLATWELEERETKMLVRAFLEAFPEASLWDSMHAGEWILLGSRRPLSIDLDAVAARLETPAIEADLEKIRIRQPADFLSLHLRGRRFLEEFTAGVPPVVDDHPIVDATIPRSARSNFGLGEGLTAGLEILGLGPIDPLQTMQLQAMIPDRRPASGSAAAGSRPRGPRPACEQPARDAAVVGS